MMSLGRSVGGSVFLAKPSWSVMVFMCPVAFRIVRPEVKSQPNPEVYMTCRWAGECRFPPKATFRNGM
jgi:hypothetical protein